MREGAEQSKWGQQGERLFESRSRAAEVQCRGDLGKFEFEALRGPSVVVISAPTPAETERNRQSSWMKVHLKTTLASALENAEIECTRPRVCV